MGKRARVGGIAAVGLLVVAGAIGSGTDTDDSTDNDADAGVATQPSQTTSASSSSTAPATTTAPETGGPGGVGIELPVLAIADAEVSSTPYDRDEYQPGGWADTDGDCQNDRHEVLIRDSLVEPTLDPSGCFVETGEWIDAYTGELFTEASQVSIDHVVPLAHAHRMGAWTWSLESKQALASDIEAAGTLVVVGQSTNNAKGSSGPADWRPSDRSAWCAFAIDWTNTKARWGLPAEHGAEIDALAEMFATCGHDGEPRPDQLAPVALASVATSSTTSSTTTTIVAEGVATPRIASCLRRAEEVTIVNDGAEPLDLGGYVLHDDGNKHSFVFPRGTTLDPGGQVTVTTGDNPTSGEGYIVWKNQNVWNNDGDTAFLLGGGFELELRCT